VRHLEKKTILRASNVIVPAYRKDILRMLEKDSAEWLCEKKWHVSIPIPAISESNTRSHYMGKAARTREQRKSTLLILKASRKAPEPVEIKDAVAKRGDVIAPVEVTLTRVGKNRIDQGNLATSMKAFQDAVADYIGIDDRRDDCVVYLYDQVSDRKADPHVEITFRLLTQFYHHELK
jgi:hypothetical protein